MIIIKETFNGGIRLGGLNNSLDIKILICFLLIKVKEPLTKEQLTQILNDDSLANYFDVMNALSELIKSGQIICDCNNNLTVSKTGEDAMNTLLNTLPVTIKDRALISANKFILKNKKLSENKVEIKKAEDGYTVKCKILDIGSDLLNIELFVGTLEQAKEVESKFLNEPSKIYKTVLEILTD